MKTLNEWFSEYGESHQNPLNQHIHTVCVPAIYASVLGLIWTIPPLRFWITYDVVVEIPWIALALIPISIFYLVLNVALALQMIVLSLCVAVGFAVMDDAGVSVLWTSVVVFVLAWIGQAYGHKVEGKKPSFFNDLAFLLIGPLWVLKKLSRQR